MLTERCPQKYVNNQESRVAHLCSSDSFLYYLSLALTDELITKVAKVSGAQKHNLPIENMSTLARAIAGCPLCCSKNQHSVPADSVLQAAQPISRGSLNKSGHFHHRRGNGILFVLEYIDFFRMWVAFRQCSDQTLIHPCPLHCPGCVAGGSWSRINSFCHIPYNPEAAGLAEKKIPLKIC